MNSYRLCAVKLGFKDISFRSNVKNVRLCYLGYRLLVRNYTSSLLATNISAYKMCSFMGQDAPGVGVRLHEGGVLPEICGYFY